MYIRIMKLSFVVTALWLEYCSNNILPNSEWGTAAKIEKWPFIAYLVFFEGSGTAPAAGAAGAAAACGGALLSSQTVLTAAHCLDDFTGYKLELGRYTIQIFMGSSNIFKATMIRTVTDYQTHFEYKIASSYADIGVAFLEKPVTFSKTVIKTILPESTQRFSKAFVAGWGVWQNSGSKTQRLLFSLSQHILPNEICKSKIADYREGMMCAGDFETTNYRFGGDSGGPLVTEDGYQIGLVSHTAGSAVTVYTNTSHFFKWIRKTQGQLFKENCAAILDT